MDDLVTWLRQQPASDEVRRIIDLHASDGGHECPYANEGGDVWIGYEAACLTLKLLALPYFGRLGYREEWRP